MKSRPQNALAPRPRCRVKDFLDDLGDLMFGDGWDTKYLRFLQSESYEPGTPGSEAFMVRENFIEAMRLGMCIAALDLTDLWISRLYPGYQERPPGPGGRIARK